MKQLPIRWVRAVTLVEVMVTVAILGILSSVMIPRYADQIRRSAEASTKGSLAILRSSLLIYFSDNIGVDASSLTVIVPNYIDVMPTSKIGKYHADSDASIDASAFGAAGYDSGGWYYIYTDGSIYANCSHTDTRNIVITNW